VTSGAPGLGPSGNFNRSPSGALGSAPIDALTVDDDAGTFSIDFTVEFWSAAPALLATRTGTAVVVGEGLNWLLDKSLGRYSTQNWSLVTYPTSDAGTPPATTTWASRPAVAAGWVHAGTLHENPATGTGPYLKESGSDGMINSYPNPITGAFNWNSAGTVCRGWVIHATQGGGAGKELIAVAQFGSSYTLPGLVYPQVLYDWEINL